MSTSTLLRYTVRGQAGRLVLIDLRLVAGQQPGVTVLQAQYGCRIPTAGSSPQTWWNILAWVPVFGAIVKMCGLPAAGGFPVDASGQIQDLPLADYSSYIGRSYKYLEFFDDGDSPAPKGIDIPCVPYQLVIPNRERKYSVYPTGMTGNVTDDGIIDLYVSGHKGCQLRVAGITPEGLLVPTLHQTRCESCIRTQEVNTSEGQAAATQTICAADLPSTSRKYLRLPDSLPA